MATSPPMSPSILTENTTRISSWLEQLPPTPPADEHHRPLKRKRAGSEPVAVHQLKAMSAHRDASPSKRQRRDSDDLLPGESISTVGLTARPLTLDGSNTFSPQSSRVSASTPRRGSPSRRTIAALRVASPPITTKPLDGVQSEPPARVMAVVARLEYGLDQGWIPGWLEVRIAVYCPSQLTCHRTHSKLIRASASKDSSLPPSARLPRATSPTLITTPLSVPS